MSTKAAKALASLAKGAPRDFYRGLGAHHFDQLLEACRAPDQAPDRERALLDLVAGAVPEHAKLAPRALDAAARVVLARPARRGWAREQRARRRRGGAGAAAAPRGLAPLRPALLPPRVGPWVGGGDVDVRAAEVAVRAVAAAA